jgi:hypothetical protein
VEIEKPKPKKYDLYGEFWLVIKKAYGQNI